LSVSILSAHHVEGIVAWGLLVLSDGVGGSLEQVREHIVVGVRLLLAWLLWLGVHSIHWRLVLSGALTHHVLHHEHELLHLLHDHLLLLGGLVGLVLVLSHLVHHLLHLGQLLLVHPLPHRLPLVRHLIVALRRHVLRITHLRVHCGRRLRVLLLLLLLVLVLVVHELLVLLLLDEREEGVFPSHLPSPNVRLEPGLLLLLLGRSHLNWLRLALPCVEII